MAAWQSYNFAFEIIQFGSTRVDKLLVRGRLRIWSMGRGLDTGHWIQQNIICRDLEAIQTFVIQVSLVRVVICQMPFRTFMIPTTPTLKCFVRRGKKSPFSNIFWEINVARESPQDRKNILYGSTIGLNCILERLLSRENCFLARHLNRKLKTPGALLRRANIKFHIRQFKTVCEQCSREDLHNSGALGWKEQDLSRIF